MANPLTALSGDLLTSLTGNVQKAKLIIRTNTQSAASGAAARAGGSLSTAQIASQAGAALTGGSQAAASAASPASRELTVQYNPSSSSFRAFAEADYETMKTYCTQSCVENYFHGGDVDGMVWASLTALGEETAAGEWVYLLASVEVETIPNSALYPDTRTAFYLELVQEDGAWRINSFPTGKPDPPAA